MEPERRGPTERIPSGERSDYLSVPLPPEEDQTFRHGTVWAYNKHKCRCDPCKAAKKVKDQRLKANRKRRLAEEPTSVPHGTSFAYGKFGCRCDACVSAQSEQMKEWRAAHPGNNAEHARRWREKNKDRLVEYRRQWRSEHPDSRTGPWRRAPSDPEFTHGTAGGYSAGCRCEGCVDAKKGYVVGWRARKVGDEIPHGTLNGFKNYGCRCAECSPVASAANSKRAAQEQEETLPTASRYGQQWTGPEMELIVTRRDLTLVQLAKMLGRTRHAVSTARSRATSDPKWRKVAGVDDA